MERREIISVLRVLHNVCTGEGRKDPERKGLDPYDWLLVQNVSLQIALLPEFSSNHQCHLEKHRQEQRMSQEHNRVDEVCSCRMGHYSSQIS